MSEMELLLVNEGENCTLYTIQFMSEDKSEFDVSMLSLKMM